MNFRRSVVIAELWRPEVARREKILHFFAFFWKNEPLPNYIITTCTVSVHCTLLCSCNNTDASKHQLYSVCGFAYVKLLTIFVHAIRHINSPFH